MLLVQVMSLQISNINTSMDLVPGASKAALQKKKGCTLNLRFAANATEQSKTELCGFQAENRIGLRIEPNFF